MNGSHLPAGQPMPGGVGVGGGPGGRGPPDMGPMPGPGAAGNGPRRRPPPHQYASHQPTYHHQQQQHVNPGHMYYNSAMNPYANSYYPPMAHYYQSGGMPASPYLPHNPYAARSPPAMHQQYPPIVSSNMQHPPPPQPYPRPPRQQPSPAVSTPPPYQPVAPPPGPIPHTPSSTHSSQAVPAPLTPTTPQTQEVSRPHPDVEVIPARAPFKAPLPWLSRPDLPFPTRNATSKRRKKILTSAPSGVELPANQQAGIQTLTETSTKEEVAAEPLVRSTPATPTPKTVAVSQTAAADVEPGEQSKDAVSETPGVTPTKTTKPASRAAVPAIPALPVRPRAGPNDAKPVEAPATSQVPEVPSTVAAETPDAESKSADAAAPAPASAPAKPSLWSGLFSRGAPAAATANGSQVPTAGAGAAATVSAANDSTEANALTGNTADVMGSFSKSNASSLAEALADFRIASGQKLAFLEPRGLINTGNMCYMNSILQVLVFCVPFYDFIDQVGKKAAHSFNSETPLIDAMIMFMREYHVIDSAVSVEKLRMRLKSEELEQFGEPFTPEFVYDAIRKLPRFASMRRGHQQDAEEFLGFLLESLHEECTHVMRHLPEPSATTNPAHSSASTATAMSSPTSATDSSDWLEVRGPKQRAAITRSSGHPITSSPLSKIFGGQLRSELKVPGLKDSVTLEPYQPLQLDIGSPQVRNIVDALKNLTRSETLHGDFGSPRGPDVTATKQVFIESVPPVLILHLKRFQFDAQGTGTMKIWKKVGYPLELELPKEVFTRGKRNSMLADGRGLPKYRLISAVYHHGKNASGGHYTVDVRRQDGREWIRMDDTVLRRVRSEDVAEGGVEEDAVKEALQSDHKRDTATGGSGNRFEGFGENEAGDDEGWNKVTTPASGGAKKWSNIANGNASTPAPAKGKQIKDSIKDNKVAYLLFYQKI